MRIAIVNDMALARESLRRVIESEAGNTVCWIATSGEEAVQRCREDRPDLILMDMIMPGVNGVEATRQIMSQTPCPILVVTASISRNSAKVFEAMGAGALDAVATPVLAGDSDGGALLLAKIRRIDRLTADMRTQELHDSAPGPERPETVESDGPPPLIAIGCSTGGPQVVLQILAGLPADLGAAVTVIQHMDQQFIAGFAQWLDSQLALPVEVADDGGTVRAGRVYIPSTNGHAVIDSACRMCYVAEPENIFYHPSVDVFFKSVARHWPGRCLGILLTGMGRDGGKGLLELKQKGHRTLAQDKESCIVYGMPKYAAQLGAVDTICPPGQITQAILHFVGHAL